MFFYKFLETQQLMHDTPCAAPIYVKLNLKIQAAKRPNHHKFSGPNLTVLDNVLLFCFIKLPLHLNDYSQYRSYH